MTMISPSSAVTATLGRQSHFLRLPPSSRCSIYLLLEYQQLQHRTFHHQHRYASNKVFRPPQVKASPTISQSRTRRNAQTVPSPSQPAPSAALSPTSQASSIDVYSFSDKINPPSTTLPAPLNVAAREPGQGAISYYVGVGRAYWAFYKTGVKNVWRNAQERRRLVRRRRLSSKKDPPPAMPDTKQNMVLDERALGQYANYPFTRAEFQFFHRSWRDAKRIPIFVILLAIFGEYLPLIVIFCTPLVPYTCRIPKQIRRAREKLEERRSKSFRGYLGGVPTPLKKGTAQNVLDLKELDSLQVAHICRSLGLYFGFWDRLGAIWPPPFVMRYRLKKRLQYVEIDDALMRRDGGVALLKGEEEIRIAAEDRGIDLLNRNTEDLQELLKKWAQESEKGTVLPMLLSRPSVWASETSDQSKRI